MCFIKTHLLVMALLISESAISQITSHGLPEIEILRRSGDYILASDISNDGKPTVISFWATWCKPCIQELNEIQELYDKWQMDTGVKMVAISIDDARGSRKVPAVVNGRGWEFEIYIDQNSDLKRALNINNIPHTLLLDGSGKIVWEHTGYTPGNEEVLYDEILKLK